MAESAAAKRPSFAATAIPADAGAAVFLGNPHLDNLMTVVIAMGAEIWSDRQRARIVERLLETHGKVTREMIEQYVPSDEERKAWEAEREAMVRRVYDVLARDASGARPFAEERR